MSKIKLNVLGISYSQTQSGAYALVLSEESGERRIPIIVGGFEAQSIAIQLEGLHPPRPLTHDLFLSFAKAFGINLIEVNIYKLEEGVFYSKLTCDDGNRRITIDARTSDAIALALRFRCPIYTTEDILQRSGIILDFDKNPKSKEKTDPEPLHEEPELENISDSELKSIETNELEDMLRDAVNNENYERASEIRDELKKRKNS